MERVDRSIRDELGRFGPVDAGIADVVRVWPAAVGATVARNAWPARFGRDGTLHVHTSSSTWAFELGNLASTILESLGRELASPPQALRFAPGPLPQPATEAAAGPARVEAGPEHLAAAAEIAAAIEDEKLRASVARAAAASLARAAAEAASDRRF